MLDGVSAWLGDVIRWLTDTIFALGYPGIVVLMAIESSVFPLPSELIMPPAGYLAAQGRMSPWLAVLAGTAGSIIGALVNYALARRLGRPLLHRYGKYLLIKEKALDRAEAYFRNHGEISTFIGRLIPLLRHYISLPAGLARMRLDRFALYTGLGAGIWCAILTWIGWYLGRQAHMLGTLSQDQVSVYVNRALLVLTPIILALIAVYVLRHRRRQRHRDRE
jgi:membrane protein DedA with SNARE-associated domain